MGLLYTEVLFTDNYNPNGQTDWVVIAVVPTDSTEFDWDVPAFVKGDKCRIAVRNINHTGSRSEPVISPGDFTIEQKQLSPPALLSPTDNGSYSKYVPFIFDHKAVYGTASQRAFYQVFYSSSKLGLDWTPVFQNIAVGSQPMNFDVKGLTASDDYDFKVVLIDDSGNSSPVVFVRGVSIRPLDYFFVDTEAPKGTVTIVGNSGFSKARGAVVNLRSFDEVTDTESVKLQQRDGSTVTSGAEQDMSDVKTWYFTGNDGIKFLEAIFKDSAGNVPNAASLFKTFRTYLSTGDSVTAFLVNGNDVYTALGGTPPVLYRNSGVVANLDGKATSMSIFGGTLYIGIETSEGTGVLQTVSSANEITDLYSFTSADSVVTATAVYGESLYVGLQNGEFYEFDGTTVSLIETFDGVIGSMKSDGNVLYIFIENSNDVKVFDGTSFTTTSLINAHQ